MLTEEVQRLEGVLGERVTRSRQHYLMLHLPHTLRSMAAAGITDDHTMGFADQIGFRAGTSRPFPFYDLPAEEESSLMLHPFAVMDGTLKDYLRMDPLQAKQAVDLLIEKVRAVRGCFSSLWHNTSLTERDGWEGWKEVYLHLVNAATG